MLSKGKSSATEKNGLLELMVFGALDKVVHTCMMYTYACVTWLMGKSFSIDLYSGVEELIKWHPDLINMTKKDGFTPIHIAAANGHTDVVSLLASHVRPCALTYRNQHYM